MTPFFCLQFLHRPNHHYPNITIDPLPVLCRFCRSKLGPPARTS